MSSALALVRSVALRQAALNDYVGFRLPPGGAVLPCYCCINFQKGGTAVFTLCLMRVFDNYDAYMYWYLAAHGSYGFAWLLKHVVVPDPRWEVLTTVPSQVANLLLVLLPYWVAPFLLASRIASPPSTWWLATCMTTYVLGLLVMMLADAQKWFTKRLQAARTLIDTGMYKYVRHPNYTGEMIVYASFAAMASHWLAWSVLAYVWLVVFVPNIVRKEVHMRKYNGWDEYARRTTLLVPFVF